MLVTLSRILSITLDLEVDVRWVIPAARQVGEATVTIPQDSPAFSEQYIRPAGGSLVTIHDQVLGVWRGAVVSLSFSSQGAVLRCQHLSAIAIGRSVGLARTFENHTAGAIARMAVADAVAGLGIAVLRMGTFVESAPMIPSFSFTGQPLSEVLGNLADESGQEWELDETGAINWGPRKGTFYPRLLCVSGDLAEDTGTVDNMSEVASVLAKDAFGRGVRAINSKASESVWQREPVIAPGTSSTALAALAAERALAAQQGSAVTYTFRLRRGPGG